MKGVGTADVVLELETKIRDYESLLSRYGYWKQHEAPDTDLDTHEGLRFDVQMASFWKSMREHAARIKELFGMLSAEEQSKFGSRFLSLQLCL